MEFYFFPYVCHDIPETVVQNTVFPHRIILASIFKINYLYMCKYISKLSIWFYWKYVLLKLVPMYFSIIKKLNFNTFLYYFSFAMSSFFSFGISTYTMHFQKYQFFSLFFDILNLFISLWLYFNIFQFFNLSFWIKNCKFTTLKI